MRAYCGAGARVLAVLIALCACAMPAAAFDQDQIERLAEKLAQAPFVPLNDKLPEAVDALGYDSFRKIRFAREKSIALGQAGFQLQTYHRGWIFRRQAKINIIRGGKSAQLVYSPDYFDFGEQPIPKASADLGFAGFRLLYPLNQRDKQDEAISFLGASYFRFIGRGQRYGLSARGLAIGAGDPNQPEEFPAFREFWIEEPAPLAQSIVIHALLDSSSVAGAYRFTLHVGARARVDVEASLFPRAPLERLGLAPLTSMFLTGAHDRRTPDAFRQEVHDSDSLLVAGQNGGWLFRPLRNPQSLRQSEFAGSAFGLLQRQRIFSLYQDIEAHYHLRPSYWVTPRSDWGAGAVRLVELPTRMETEDNIVAYFAPGGPAPQPGAAFRFAYSIDAFNDDAPLHDLARVHATHQKISASADATIHTLLVDFAGGDLAYYSSNPSGLSLDVKAPGAKILRAELAPHAPLKGLRAQIDLKGAGPVDVRATIKLGQRLMSETWTFPVTLHAPEVTASTPHK